MGIRFEKKGESRTTFSEYLQSLPESRPGISDTDHRRAQPWTPPGIRARKHRDSEHGSRVTKGEWDFEHGSAGFWGTDTPGLEARKPRALDHERVFLHRDLGHRESAKRSVSRRDPSHNSDLKTSKKRSTT